MPDKPTISLKVELDGLNRSINRFAVATGRTREDVATQAMRGMIRYALEQTPPAGGGNTGKAAQRAGESAINRDLNKMGFRPVELKHKRKENPLFEDPDTYHRDYLEGRAKRMLFFADKTKVKTMVKRLYAEIGKLSSGWILAALETGVPVPAWIMRHFAEGRGDVTRTDIRNVTTLTAINHVPNKAAAVASELERRKAYWARYARGDLDRQLHAKLAGNWHK